MTVKLVCWVFDNLLYDAYFFFTFSIVIGIFCSFCIANLVVVELLNDSTYVHTYLNILFSAFDVDW